MIKKIKESFEILTELNEEQLLKDLELYGRVAYKSEYKITNDSSKKFVKTLIKNNHLSVIEHKSITVKFIMDRGTSHELVRHRLTSITQESTRYVNYHKSNNVIRQTFKVIDQDSYMNSEQYNIWLLAMENSMNSYNKLIEAGCKPQAARSVLTNSTKTEVIMTANLREWRLILKMRTHKSAHPQIRYIFLELLKELKQKLPTIFEDI